MTMFPRPSSMRHMLVKIVACERDIYFLSYLYFLSNEPSLNPYSSALEPYHEFELPIQNQAALPLRAFAFEVS